RATEQVVDAYGVGRVLAFSDGVFAIAITLLVLNIPIPGAGAARPGQLEGQLWNVLPNVLAFAWSFLLVGSFWLRHHRLFRNVVLCDGRLLWLNLATLFFVCLLPFPTALEARFQDMPTAVQLYAGNLAMIGVMYTIMFEYASRPPRSVGVDRAARRTGLARNLSSAAVFVLVVILARFSPLWANVAFLLLIPALALGGRLGGRSTRRA
ncbi:MAG: TMEM175 family protein, partial [Candidatus Dormibacteraeota bacterium]|nr:TMEM175 family protein [Candidatus Dormibacteraeota bacterium]